MRLPDKGIKMLFVWWLQLRRLSSSMPLWELACLLDYFLCAEKKWEQDTWNAWCGVSFMDEFRKKRFWGTFSDIKIKQKILTHIKSDESRPTKINKEIVPLASKLELAPNHLLTHRNWFILPHSSSFRMHSLIVRKCPATRNRLSILFRIQHLEAAANYISFPISIPPTELPRRRPAPSAGMHPLCL